MFSAVKSREEGDSGWTRRASYGAIIVERTFNVTELKEFPPVAAIHPMPSVKVPKRTRSRKGMGIFTDTTRLFEKSSEKDLVEPRSPGRSLKK